MITHASGCFLYRLQTGALGGAWPFLSANHCHAIIWHSQHQLTTAVPFDLCETEDGDRYIEYRPLGGRVKNLDWAIDSIPILTAEIRMGGFSNLEQILKLSSGDQFWFDGRGYWQTSKPITRIGEIDRSWHGMLEGLLSREEAEAIATRYGHKIGLATFEIEFSLLLDRDGEPVWFVSLIFAEEDPNWIGDPSAVIIHVHAKTRVTEHTPSL